jgi:hypothetical protein
MSSFTLLCLEFQTMQTQHHNHKPKAPRHPHTYALSVPAQGSGDTIGFCLYILNGQFIMPRIKKTNNWSHLPVYYYC